MKIFFITVFAATSLVNVLAVPCCELKKIYFRHKPGYTCDSFPNTYDFNAKYYCTPFFIDDPTLCETEICLDGKYHEHCSIGKCKRSHALLLLGNEDTAKECYGNYRTKYDAFAQVWAKEHEGVLDYFVEDSIANLSSIFTPIKIVK